MSQSWWSRFFGTKQNANETKNEKSLEEQRKDLEETIRINRLRKAAKLTESYADTDYWLTAYADLLARYKDGFALAYPITQPTDRRYGGNFPFWYSEQQLGLIRAQARMVTTMSPNAQGLLNGLTSYVIGSGYRYDVVLKPDREVPDRIMIKVQDVIDEFCENNAWTELEQELFWRSREDGEFFLRLFPQENGKLMVRVIEPEQVFMPPGGSLFDYSYGIRTDADDVCNVIGYAVSYIAPGGEGEKEPNPMATEEVPADRIVHVKVNTKRNIKRGLSDFSYDTLEAFQTAAKLRTNLGEGSAVQAAIAGVRQHDAASYSQVDSFVGSQTDYAQYSPVTQRATDFQQIKSGTFVDIPKGMNFVPPPGAAANAISGHLEVFQALLRSAGNRHNAPEWLVSADASNNNYASSMTAESPFLRHCKRLQEFYKRPFLRVIKAAIENAIDAGKLPTNIMEFIDITATPPELEVQDKSAQAMANQVYAGLGVKSRQTIAHELGLDWDTELTNQQEYAEQMGAASPLPMPGQEPGEGPPDGGNPNDDGPDSPDDNSPGLREEFVESIDDDDEEAMQVSGESVGEAERYAHINFSPPKAARDAAARALAARKRKSPSERGMTATGIARARDLVAGKKLSPDTIRRMHSFFSRHEVDKKGESWDSQGKGWQAWNGWGGDAGFAFARKVIRQMDAADAKEAADPAISAKISKLRAEGYPQKQAVAIALSMSRRGELGEGRWVTMGAKSKAPHNRKEGDEGEKHGGVAVYIDDDGTILKGPAHMTGKKPNEIKKQQRIGAEPVPAQGTIFGAHTEPPKSAAEQAPEPAQEPVSQQPTKPTVADPSEVPSAPAAKSEEQPAEAPKANTQKEPDPISEPTTDLAKAAEPKKSDTPRDIAKRVTDENAKNYAFARDSSVSNMGEDLLGSARHTRNLWRGLEQAERDGTAAEMISRENLMKVEPHRLLEKLTPKNALSSLAGHLALSIFPAEVGDYVGLKKPTPPEELRKQYFDAYREIKDKIESGVSEGLKPQQIMFNATELASDIIEKLRKPSPENANKRPNQIDQYSDLFNPVANGLVDFVNKARDGIRYSPNKTSPMGRLHDFVKRIAEKYGDQVSVETLNHIAKHVGDIIEGDSFNKTFGTVKKGARKFDPSNAYDVANVTRTGGRKINATTIEDASRHLMDNAKLRGVQWGNYVTDDERKHHATKLSEALADLADSLGIPDSAVSLGGRLGMAIGARGKAGAMAHYEPKMQVINLTRSKGVGSLAHEWAHALDHSIEGFGKDLASQRMRDTPAGKAMSEFRKAIGTSGYSDRLRDALHANKFLTDAEKKYWSSNEEVFARTMERFIQRRLQSAGRQNTYLVGLKKETHEFWPNDKEMETMEKPITTLIDAIRETHLK